MMPNNRTCRKCRNSFEVKATGRRRKYCSGRCRQADGRVWCNQPYDREIGQWLRKAAESTANGDAEIVVCLVPARVDTAWWHDYCAGAAEARFLKGRLRFGDSDSGAPFPSAVVFRHTTGVTKHGADEQL